MIINQNHVEALETLVNLNQSYHSHLWSLLLFIDFYLELNPPYMGPIDMAFVIPLSFILLEALILKKISGLLYCSSIHRIVSSSDIVYNFT